MSGIVAFGAYIPRPRLQRSVVAAAHSWFAPSLKGLAKGERAASGWDEDVITMAVEAARDCLGDRDRSEVKTVVLASTSLPNADRQNSGIVKEALNLADATGSLDNAGGLRAGTSALIQSLNAAAGSGGLLLCVASEKRKSRPGSENELLNGDAASALLVGPGDGIARLIGAHSTTIDFVDHFRASGKDFDYGWEARWVRDEGYNKIAAGALREALKIFGIAGQDVAHLIVPIAVRGVPEALAKTAGVPPEAVQDTLGATVGDAGTAHPGLMLAAALEKAQPGQKIVVLGFGQGCDVIAFEVTDAILSMPKPRGVSGWLARRKPEDNYFRYLTFNGLLDVEKGMRAEADFKQALTALYRNRKTVHGLVGGRCTKTGTVQFPRSDISVNPNDNAVGTQEDYPLAEKAARILTYTADNLTYTPNPPAYYGMIEFEGGGRMVAEFVDSDPGQIEVGNEVRMVFRVKSVDELRGFTKYFWKATPV